MKQEAMEKERKGIEKKVKLSQILHDVADRGYEQCRFGFKKDYQYCALGGVLDYLGVGCISWNSKIK